MLKIGLILLGGGLGAVMRYLLSTFILQYTGPSFPSGTLAVNLVGCFAIGLLSGFAERTIIAPELRMFLQIGILGGFTTFSSLGLETFQILRDGEIRLAALSVLLNNFGGIALVWLGYIMAQVILNRFNQ